MAKAIWSDTVIAESDETIIVEGNHYFPFESVNQDFLRPSEQHTTCYWKGVASYYDIEVDGKINRGGAWYYPDPSDAAKQIKDYVAFWKGVKVTS
jgi:uncharacterized protein (DUF427 family)